MLRYEKYFIVCMKVVMRSNTDAFSSDIAIIYIHIHIYTYIYVYIYVSSRFLDEIKFYYIFPEQLIKHKVKCTVCVEIAIILIRQQFAEFIVMT